MRHRRPDLTDRPHFPGVSRDELAAIDRNVTEMHVGPGTTLTREGAYGQEVFLIVDGTAEVRVDGRTVATLVAGDVVGELAVLGVLRRTATVVTTSDATVLVSNPREFAAILADAPRLGERIRRSAASKLVARRRALDAA